MRARMFSLVDCDNFYVSCERVFRPSLQDKPVVVLSNNDGCIVARSNEVRELGIPTGAPYHKWKKSLKQHGVVVLSPNYVLYQDMSNRIMQMLAEFTPSMEVYSLDEAFVIFAGIPVLEMENFISSVRAKVYKWTGIPVSIGAGATKTLAKAAVWYAKKRTSKGIFTIHDSRAREHILGLMEIEDVWGISKGWGRRLRAAGITTALDLMRADADWLYAHFSVVLGRLARELQGDVCLDLEHTLARKSIMSSCSFGRYITRLGEMGEALGHYTAQACRRLRRQKSCSGGAYVFVSTNPFCSLQRQYQAGCYGRFDDVSSDTGFIIGQAKALLRKIYKAGYKYKKSGIILMDIVPEDNMQRNLFFADREDDERVHRRGRVVDEINRMYGNHTLFYASQGMVREWSMRSENRSPRYTTNWEELAQSL